MKYCGGCNPRYDRVEAASSIQERLKSLADIVSPEDEGAEAVVVIAGCPTACADVSSFDGMPIRFVRSMEEVEALCSVIDRSGLAELRRFFSGRECKP